LQPLAPYKGSKVPKQILIVDDSCIFRRKLREILGQEPGWQVCGEARNGSEGLEKARQLQPDLVVLDLSMPGMNGLDMAEEINQILPDLPLLLFTNYDANCLKREGLFAGVRTTLSKSEPVGTLIKSIHGLLDAA
jgi:DNA-binding NarL/FixJ family response regulator